MRFYTAWTLSGPCPQPDTAHHERNVSCYPFLVRPELESSGVMAQAGGGAGEPITSDIGGLLPIPLWGRSSL